MQITTTHSRHTPLPQASARCPHCGNAQGTCACEAANSALGALRLGATNSPKEAAGEKDLGLTTSELNRVRELERTDKEVRSHEAAHVSVGGQHVRGGAQYQFETGPDEKQYAVSGEVAMDTAPIPGNPEATIRKAQQVRRAAMAPAQPSAQDQQVAAQAAQMEVQARTDKTILRQNPDSARPAATLREDLERAEKNPPRHAIQAYEKAAAKEDTNRDAFSSMV